MNERIEQLLKQSMEDLPRPDYHKFAKLIVQECSRVAKATDCPYHGNELTPQNAHTWDMASLESGKGILDHFGVEE